jgi:hypothetical protein
MVTSRVLCHAAVELPLAVVALVQIVQGWLPTQDDAAIAIRSWAIFTSHPPLLGQFTAATSCGGQNAYSPGPLEYWLLAVPVRIDPVHGVLWGAALAAAVGMGVCVEAAWAVQSQMGAIAVAGAGLILLASQSPILINPTWNPYLGCVWFAAACMTAWAVGMGRLRWWPPLVLSASIAVQSHLQYALPSLVLCAVAPVAGMVRQPPRRWRWLVAGVAVGAGCWAVPLAQEVTGRPGNMTVLLRCVGNAHTFGQTFGLRALTAAVVPPPLWFAHPPGLGQLLTRITHSSPLVGAGILVLLVGTCIAAWVTHRTQLGVLAGVTAVAASAAIWDLAEVPTANFFEMGYLDTVLWPVSLLVWAVLLWALVEVARAAWDRRQNRSRSTRLRLSREALGARVALLILTAATANTVLVASDAFDQSAGAAGGPGGFSAVEAAAAAVQDAVPRGPVVVTVNAASGYASQAVVFGTVWRLISDGRQATVPSLFRAGIEPPAYRVAGSTMVAVTVRPDGSVPAVRAIRPPEDRRPPADGLPDSSGEPGPR